MSVILNMSETEKGLEPYGKKVEKAIDAWREVATGKATIDVVIKKKNDSSEAKTVRLPNPFALQRNEELMTTVIDNYVVPKIGRVLSKPSENASSKEIAMYALEEEDNISAAITALILL